jgi:5-hydroxyisourate hydrolase
VGPRPGVRVELYDGGGELVAERLTNADGRTDAPLLVGGTYRPGPYELRFHVAAYSGPRARTCPTRPSST